MRHVVVAVVLADADWDWLARRATRHGDSTDVAAAKLMRAAIRNKRSADEIAARDRAACIARREGRSCICSCRECDHGSHRRCLAGGCVYTAEATYEPADDEDSTEHSDG